MKQDCQFFFETKKVWQIRKNVIKISKSILKTQDNPAMELSSRYANRIGVRKLLIYSKQCNWLLMLLFLKT